MQNQYRPGGVPIRVGCLPADELTLMQPRLQAPLRGFMLRLVQVLPSREIDKLALDKVDRHRQSNDNGQDTEHGSGPAHFKNKCSWCTLH